MGCGPLSALRQLRIRPQKQWASTHATVLAQADECVYLHLCKRHACMPTACANGDALVWNHPLFPTKP